MPYDNTYSYIVRTGSNSRINDSVGNPLIVSADSLKENLRRINAEHPYLTYEAIPINDFKKKMAEEFKLNPQTRYQPSDKKTRMG